jgi:hypothetical protein
MAEIVHTTCPVSGERLCARFETLGEAAARKRKAQDDRLLQFKPEGRDSLISDQARMPGEPTPKYIDGQKIA